MAKIHAFKAVRPSKEYVEKVASLPYDVMNRAEARQMAEGNPYSFLHVVRADLDLPDSVDAYDESVYKKSREAFDAFMADGVLKQDEKPCFYVYRQIMDGNQQTGLVACTSIDEYFEGKIKKHELTREEKLQDRINHFNAADANTAPIFLTYRASEEINAMIKSVTDNKELFCDFVSDDGIRHMVWVIDDEAMIEKLIEAFAKIDALYIADGHHRTESAAQVGEMRRKALGIDPEAEYNYFMAVLFPDNELKVFDYNRVLRDLNGMKPEELLEKIGENFEIEEHEGEEPYRPQAKHEFGMYLEGKWYKLKAKPAIVDENDPIGRLDVHILQIGLLEPILGIGDPRLDSRIDFVGGIRGLKELEKRCEKDMKLAFAMYPTSVEDLMQIADADMIMPPKSTWFEPKLRSGLFVHKLS